MGILGNIFHKIFPSSHPAVAQADTPAVVQGISYRYCTMVQRADGYGYGYGYSFNMDSNISASAGHATRAALSLPDMNVGVSRATSR